MVIELTDEEIKFISRLLRLEIYYTEDVYTKLKEVPSICLNEDTLKHLTEDWFIKTILAKIHGLSEYTEDDSIEYEEIDLWNSPGWLKPIDFKKLDRVLQEGAKIEIICKNGTTHRISAIDTKNISIPFLLDTKYDSWESLCSVDKIRLPEGTDIYKDLDGLDPNCRFTTEELFTGIKDNTLDVQVLLDGNRYVTLLGGYGWDTTFKVLQEDNPFILPSEVQGYKINGVDFKVKNIEIL